MRIERKHISHHKWSYIGSVGCSLKDWGYPIWSQRFLSEGFRSAIFHSVVFSLFPDYHVSNLHDTFDVSADTFSYQKFLEVHIFFLVIKMACYKCFNNNFFFINIFNKNMVLSKTYIFLIFKNFKKGSLILEFQITIFSFGNL